MSTYPIASPKTDHSVPINVLHLTSSKGFYGIDRVIVALAKYIDRRSFNLSVANIEKKQVSSRAIVAAAQSAGVDAVMVPCRGRFDWSTVKRLKSMVRAQRIQILHCHESKSRLYGSLVARLTGVPVVSTQHVWTHQDWKTRIGELVDAGCLHFSDKVIAVSCQAARSMERVLIPSRQIETITNGIDIDEFSETIGDPTLKASLGIPAGMPVIGTVGRLEIDKGRELLVEAARHVSEKGREAAYLLVGEGNELANLHAMAHRLGVADRIFFTGYQKDVRPFLALMDIFVVPSRSEGTPMALLEAMLMRKPVVVTPVGGIPDVVSNGMNGIVLRERNAVQLAEGLLTLLSDQALARRLGERGRRCVESEFSARRMAERYESVYQECLASRSRHLTVIQ